MSKNWKKAAVTFALLFGFGAPSLLTSCGGTSEVTKGISFAQSEMTLYVSDSQKIDYSVGDEEATITWESSDTKVATVKRGTVTGKGEGTCTITASLETGEKASLTVTVLSRSVKISKTEATIDLDSDVKTVQLSAEASDGGAITWTSSDPSIASVDANGLVTGLDVGTATIIAARGSARAECLVTVIMPSRPADYYRLTKLTNANVVADPGTWHYHVDGSLNSDYSFVDEPLHQNNSLTTTLGNLNLEAKKYFYFRYQPTFDIGKKYTVTYTIEATQAMKVNCSDGKNATKSKNLTANTPTQITYVGEMNESQPFHISIASCEALQNGTATTLKVTDISFVEGDTTGGADSDTPERSEHADETAYDLERMTNANVVNNTGAWYYSTDGSEGVDYTFAETPNYNNGVVTFSFTNMAGQKPYNQIRYQPDYARGTWYKISFRAQVTAAATLTYGTKYSNDDIRYEKAEVEAGTYNYEYVGKVNAFCPFSINLSAVDYNAPIALIVDNIVIEETEEPEDENNYTITKGTKSDTTGTPGRWFYLADGTAGTDYELAGTPNVKDGVISIAFNHLAGQKATNQLRYQPNFPVGTNYKIELTATLSAEGSLVLGSEVGSEKNYVTHTMEAGVAQTLTFSSTVDASCPFSINIKPTDYNAPITLTITDFSVSEYTEPEPEPEPEPSESYTITKGTKSETIASPGTWFYLADGTAGTDYELAGTPSVTDGVISIAFNHLAGQKATNQLRYQPDLSVGTNYKIDLTATLSAAGSIVLGAEVNGEKNYVTHTMEAGVAQTLTFSSTVDSSCPFSINIKPTDYNAPIALTITDFTVTEVTATDPEPEPEPEPEPSETYNLEWGNKSTVCSNPGTWYYMADGTLGTNYSFPEGQVPSYTDGSVTFPLQTLTSSNAYQLRYQPEFATGTKYVATLDISVTAETNVIVGIDGSTKTVTPNVGETMTVTYEGTVNASNPFFLQLKPVSYDAPITLTVSSYTFEEKIEDPEDVSYTLSKKSNADVIAAAGTWCYMADGTNGTDYSFVDGVEPTYNNGTVTMALATMTSDKIYQLRYQPGFEVGASYTATFKVTLSADGYFLYGNDYKKCEPSEVGATSEITYTGTVSASNPFMIQIKPADYSVPMTITVSEINFTLNA